MRHRRLVVIGLSVALLAGMVALLPVVARAAREADLIVSQKNDVDTFDPGMSTNTSTHNITINIFDTLVRLADNGRDFVPELAESWRVDPTTWRFKPAAA
jgi:ABC-type transport system substrate-binding protein